MFLSVNWLKEYINIQSDLTDFTKKISASGSHVESIINLRTLVSGVVTAKILSIKKHNNADKLSVCEVDFGNKKDIIVTAAKNMREGDIVGVAIPGAILADGTNIQPHDFRGIISNGMFVSFEEIGYSKELISKKDKEGILILPEDTKTGINVFDALNMDGVIEFEITPNRPDCLSVVGMAVEAQATLNNKRKPLKVIDEKKIKEIDDFEVVNQSEKIQAYTGGIIRNVKIQESPLYIKTRLMESGIRPVNNIVDITNYVMLETGIPLHAFDLDKISTDKLVLKEAVSNEELKLIDEKVITTFEGDILITDGEKPLALAGIMGLMNSEVDDNTRNVFIEGANFDRNQIRNTSKRLGLNTEASSRFQKSLDSNLAKVSVLRAITLAYEQGFEECEYREYYRNNKKKTVVETRLDKVNSLLGTNLNAKTCQDILNRLEIPTEIKGDFLVSEIPSTRSDLEIEADIIEEIGRIYGFEKIAPKPISTDLTVGYESNLKINTNKIRHYLQGAGFMEVLTYSFVGPSNLEKINLNDKDNFIKIKNPLGEEFSIMRPTMNAHFLEIAEKNNNRFNGQMDLFEIGHVFSKTEDDYLQNTILTILKYESGDFYSLKDTVDSILGLFGIKDFSLTRSKDSFFHPGRSAEILKDDVVIAKFGQVHPEISNKFGLNEVFIANLNVDLMTSMAVNERLYKAPSKFPSVNRELSIVLDSHFMFGEVAAYLRSLNFDYVNEIYYADEYHDESLDDKKSLTIRINLGSYEGTLKDSEIKMSMDKILKALNEKFDARLR